MNAPMPASAHCPSEICPQKPVTSTIESRTMPKINEVVIASTHFCESTNSSAAVAAVTPTMTPGRSRPVPSAGRRSNTYPDRQRRAADHEEDHDHEEGGRHADPERGATQPADVGEVVVERRLEHPDEQPGGERDGERGEPPDQRRASAASTRLVSWYTFNPPKNGMISTPARPASPAPNAQLAPAIRSGDHPIAEDARSFSATAVVASPKRVIGRPATTPR